MKKFALLAAILVAPLSANAEEVLYEGDGPFTLGGSRTTITLKPVVSSPPVPEIGIVDGALCFFNDEKTVLDCPDLDLTFELKWVQKD